MKGKTILCSTPVLCMMSPTNLDCALFTELYAFNNSKPEPQMAAVPHCTIRTYRDIRHIMKYMPYHTIHEKIRILASLL